LKGFIVDVRCSSENLLEVELDCSHLGQDGMRAFVRELEGFLKSVDMEFSSKSWLMGRGERVKADYRDMKVRFTPLPISFSNLVSNTRSDLYRLVDQYCLVIEEGVRKTYLLPKALAPEFLERFDDMNREMFERLTADIEKYTSGSRWRGLKALLERHGFSEDVLDRDFVVPLNSVRVLPVDMEYSVESDPEYSGRLSERGVALLKGAVDRVHGECVLKAREDVVVKLLDLADTLQRRGFKFFAKKVERLKVFCDAVGLTQLNAVLEALLAIYRAGEVDMGKVAEELLGTRNIREGVEAEVKRLLQG